MSIEVVRGASRKPVASAKLIDVLSRRMEWSGRLLVGYPIARTSTGPNRIDALWISEDKGIVAFDLVEGTNPGDHGFRQDDSANQIERRLRGESELVRRRRLRIPIHTISFAPAANVSASQAGDHPLAGAHSITDELARFEWPEHDPGVYRLALSVIDKVSRIRSGRVKRTVRRDDSRGARLKRLEDSIATLDHLQSKAILETVDGVQRIRGLAGSGKTIVLALKAAYLHAQYPDWRIAVTFNTRSLKGFYRRLIRDFHFDQTEEEPDWRNLRILDCWGAPGAPERDGIYHEFCLRHGVDYLDFRSARAKFGNQQAFAGACRQALDKVREPQRGRMYDALLVDEAQDLPPVFLSLCHAILKEPRRLVYAYDELQNLTGESLPSPEDIFGRTCGGESRVRFDEEGDDRPRQDVVLHTCYRNSRPVLVTAHALGFGIYRPTPKGGETGLVQMFDHPNLWEAVGYRVRNGELREDTAVTLCRTKETSPEFLENHSPIDDLIRFKSFDSEIEQARWLAAEIGRNLEEDDLHHGDIMVINPDPLMTRKKVGVIRARLLDMGIQSHLAGVDTDPDVFFEPDAASVTFTGIHRAKGNEAAMVYIVNADDCQSAAYELAGIRNRLFTAITRSKAWVRVLGVGPRMKELTREYEELKDRQFVLSFKYPSARERARLRVVHRDMTRKERQGVERRNRDLGQLIQDIEHGGVHLEDLDKAALDKLADLLQRRSR